jgi:hypothetical protein
MQVFMLKTKGLTLIYSAKDKDYAFAMFFKDVADERIPISEIGNLVMLYDTKKKGDKSEYPFRVAPLLFQMKLLSQDAAVSNIIACTGVTQKEAEDMLFKTSFADSRILPIIDELRREEQK